MQAQKSALFIAAQKQVGWIFARCQNIENLDGLTNTVEDFSTPLLFQKLVFIIYFVLLFLWYVCFGFEISFTSSSPSCPYQRPYFLCRARVGVPCGAFTWANRSANSTPVHLGPSNTWSGPWEPGVEVHGEEVCVRKRSDIFRLTAVPCFHGCSTDQ